MILGLLLLAAIFMLYVLLVKGALWKIIVYVFGYFGMYVALVMYFPNSKHTCITFDHTPLSWAIVIPVVIILLALAYTHED